MFFIWRVFQKNRIKNIETAFSEENIAKFGLIDRKGHKKRWFSRASFLLAFAFFSLALARPQFGQRQRSMMVSESSVVFLIDISRSMLTKDIQPSRLAMVKQEIIQSLKVLAEVKIGLVIFAGSVDVLSPMTSDKEAIESYVESLNVDSVSSQGTQVYVGLEESKALFDRTMGKDSEGNKLIVLFSDGETHEKKSVSFAKSMSKEGYKLITVGVGTESGGYVPESSRSNSYIRDASGQAVVSKPNFPFLKNLASAGRGSFYYLSPVSPLGPKIKKNLDKLETVAASRKKFVVRSEGFQIFILLGFLCVLIGVWLKRI